jgi:hypothetical protein
MKQIDDLEYRIRRTSDRRSELRPRIAVIGDRLVPYAGADR